MSFSCKPNDKSNYIISSVLHICFPALGGQTRGKQRIPNHFEKKWQASMAFAAATKP
jgi:hypothetical protein